jgi:hypothetical protein
MNCLTRHTLLCRKVQGVTIREPNGLILDLRGGVGAARATVASIYIGISRVQSNQQLRILPLTSCEKHALSNLEFDEHLVAWLSSTKKTTSS